MVRAAALAALAASASSVPTDPVRLALDAGFRGANPEASLAERPFTIRLPVVHSAAATGPVRSRAFYRIDGDRRWLQLSIDPASSYDSHPALLPLRTRYSVTGSFIGQTALGVRVRVQQRQDQTDTLALVAAPLPDLIPADRYTRAIRRTIYDADLSSPIPASDLEAVIEGRIAALPSGKLVGCSDMFYEADITAPTDVKARTCWVGASVSRIAFRQKSSGKTLKEWTEVAPADVR